MDKTQEEQIALLKEQLALLMQPEFLVAMALGLLIGFAFLWNIRKTIVAIKPHNRVVKPNHVWLMFIPLVNLVYQFFLVHKVAQSLFNEFNERNMPTKPVNIAYNLGMVACILNILSLVPQLAFFASFLVMVFMFAFWTRLFFIRKVLEHVIKTEDPKQ